MKKTILLFLIPALFPLLLKGQTAQITGWQKEKHKGFTLMYTSSDSEYLPLYEMLTIQGIESVSTFFGLPFLKEATICVHPGRRSLDSTWQRDWSMPEFTSECWMVASGTAERMDMISPVRWETEACEHRFADSLKTVQLITHELVHVFHGQRNVSPDFSNTAGIDWLIEGLATYASGQCDGERMSAVKKAIAENAAPGNLDSFWKGNLKYGLSGSMVMYIDKTFGREKLISLLPYASKAEVFSQLGTNEQELLEGWKIFMRNQK